MTAGVSQETICHETAVKLYRLFLNNSNLCHHSDERHSSSPISPPLGFDPTRRRSSLSISYGRNLLPPVKEHDDQHATSPRTEQTNNVDDDNDNDNVLWMDLDKLGNLFSHEGSSFYLRLGALCKSIDTIMIRIIIIIIIIIRRSCMQQRTIANRCQRPLRHNFFTQSFYSTLSGRLRRYKSSFCSQWKVKW